MHEALLVGLREKRGKLGVGRFQIPQDHQSAITLICDGSDQGPYCEVVEIKQKDRLKVHEGIPEADRKRTHACSVLLVPRAF